MTDFLLIILIVVSLANLFEIRRWRRFVVLLAFGEGAVQAQNDILPSPANEVTAALADVKKLAPEQAKYTRYLSLYNIAPGQRANFVKVLNFHVNNLSTEADLALPRKISETLYAVEADAYGWELTTFARLGFDDPWFHAKALVEKEKITVHAPWLRGPEIAELSTRVHSIAPILRADFFIFQTGEQLNRNKHGYYDMLKLAKLADAEKLAGLDRVTAIRIRKELAAIVVESQVALNSRQIFRFGSVGGSWWETRDADTNVDRSNAVRNLNGDFAFQANEIYFTLPNGLFGFALANNKGDLIESAPDKIAGDRATTNSDHRVRVGISCLRCHTDGLRAIDDYARKVFKVGNELALGSPDRDKARRLKQLYLGPLQENLVDDRTRYAKILFGLTGWKTDELAKNYAAVWAAYESDPITLSLAARELGCTDGELMVALKANLQTSGLTDLALAGFLATPPVPIRREIFEEQVGVLMGYLRGVKP